MNLNQYVNSLTRREGKKISASLAQVHEILKLIREDFGAADSWYDVHMPGISHVEIGDLFRVVTGRTLRRWVDGYLPE